MSAGEGAEDGSVVVPGDKLRADITSLSPTGIVQIGTGLTQTGEDITAVQAGVVHWMTKIPGQGMRAWVDCNRATKRSRPRLQIGTIVYARVSLAIKDCEPEITCISLTKKKGWMTGQAVFGELEGGHMFEIGIGYARALLHPDSPVINLLGKHIPYEVAVGANGRVWVKSGSVQHTVLISNAIQNAEFLSTGQVTVMVEEMLKFHAQSD